MAATTLSMLQRNSRCAMAGALALLLAAAMMVAPARADDDLPARVGRIADVGGLLYLAPEDRANEWAEIGINYPVTSGDNLWVSADGRAEIDFGGGQFRLAGDTNVHVSRLDDHELSLFIAQGRAIIRVRALDPGDSVSVDTPNTQVALQRPGLYRIDVSGGRLETTLVVREGEATAAVGNGLQQVLPGQTATLFGDRDVQADVRNGTGLDGFDTWSADRDRRYRQSRTASYVSPQMVGASDLEAYGSWTTAADYGAVWFPQAVAPDWAPYRYGRWTTLSGYGLTWVDDAPWGYAPFHYGRWVSIGGRWGWCPGRYVARPVWAPALVAWYGGGGYAVGGVGPVYGWVPLGWRDPYIPGWRNCSNRCWSGYNRPYAVNVAERPRQPPATYANYRVPGAITAVPGAAFAAGKPVAPNVVNVPGAQFANAPAMQSGPMLKPLPISASSNVVRPGNGVPVPASAAFGTTKPMRVNSPPANAAQGAPAPWSKPGAVYNAAEPRPRVAGPLPSPPQGQPARAPAPAYNAAEMPQRGTPGPTAAPGAAASGQPPAANAAPPSGGVYAPPPRARAPDGAPVVMNRAETPRAPQASVPVPASMVPRAAPPQPAALPPPTQGLPAPRIAPAPPRAVAVPQAPGRVAPPPAMNAPPPGVNAAPPPGAAAPHPVEKPMPKAPAPAPGNTPG